MSEVVKLQKIGNSIRATIPKELVDTLSLKQGEDMIVALVDDTIVMKKKRDRKLGDFYGALKERVGEVENWPTPEEIKSIWE